MKNFPLPTNPSSSLAARWGRRCVVLLLSALLGSLGAPAAQAQESPSLAGVYKAHDLTYRVWGCNPGSRPGRVRLVGENGQVLSEQVSSTTNLGGLFNLSNLPDGRYAFRVEIGHETHRFDVQLRTTAQRLAEVSADQPLASPRLLSAARPAETGHQ